MPPKILRPDRSPQVCERDFEQISVARIDEFSISSAPGSPVRLCLRCGNETYRHAPRPPPAPVVAVAPVAHPAASSGSAPVAPPLPPIAPPGPLRVSRVEQYAPSGLSFMAHMNLWRASRVCADDSDSVKSAFELLEAAWFHGANEVANFCVSSAGDAAATHTTTFDWAPIPAAPAIPAGTSAEQRAALEAAAATDRAAYRRRRSRELLGQLATARAVLRLARAFARRRVVVDRVAKFFVIQPERMSDEWAAIDAAEHELPAMTAQDIELDAEHFRGPTTALWWFLAAATFPVNALQTRLERLVRDYGIAYRAANSSTFVPWAVWNTKHSSEALARARGKPSPSGVGQKRDRDDDNDDASRRPPAKTSRRQRRRRAASAAAAAGNAGNKPGGGTREPPASDATSAADSSTGTRTPTLSAASTRLNPSPPASVSSAGRGNGRGGRGAGRGRGNTWVRGAR